VALEVGIVGLPGAAEAPLVGADPQDMRALPACLSAVADAGVKGEFGALV
jgi:hypothetical protein